MIRADAQLCKPTSGRYAPVFPIGLVAMTVAGSIGPGVPEGLRRIRVSLSGPDMSDPGRPIGDQEGTFHDH